MTIFAHHHAAMPEIQVFGAGSKFHSLGEIKTLLIKAFAQVNIFRPLRNSTLQILVLRIENVKLILIGMPCYPSQFLLRRRSFWEV